MAMEEACKAFSLGEVPVGAVLTDETGKILASTHNTKEREKNPCSHAEILAISQASKEMQNWRLINCSLYVTLEPCIMCMGAIVNSRLTHLFFGTYDKKAGAVSLGFNIHQHPKLNHNIGLTGGILHYECSRLLSDFFKSKRKFY